MSDEKKKLIKDPDNASGTLQGATIDTDSESDDIRHTSLISTNSEETHTLTCKKIIRNDFKQYLLKYAINRYETYAAEDTKKYKIMVQEAIFNHMTSQIYHSLATSTSEVGVFIVSMDGLPGKEFLTIRDCNRTAQVLTGRIITELENVDIGVLLPSVFENEHMERFRAYFKKWREEGTKPISRIIERGWTRTEMQVLRNKIQMILDVGISVVPDNNQGLEKPPNIYFLYFRDESREANFEYLLTVSKNLIKRSKECWVTTDPKGKMLDMSPSACTVLGYDRKMIKNRKPNIISIMDPNFYGGVAAKHNMIMARAQEAWVKNPVSFQTHSPIINKTRIVNMMDVYKKIIPVKLNIRREGDVYFGFFTVIGDIIEKKEINQKIAEAIVPDSMVAKTVTAMKSGNPEDTLVECPETTSMLFADLVGSTKKCREITTKKMAIVMQKVFSYIDDLTKSLNSEVLKRDGDGIIILTSGKHHAMKAIAIGFCLIEWMNNEYPNYFFRVGVASVDWENPTGRIEAVVGLFGKSRATYDGIGSLFNFTARLQGSADPGSVQICAKTYRVLSKGNALKKLFYTGRREYSNGNCLHGMPDIIAYCVSEDQLRNDKEANEVFHNRIVQIKAETLKFQQREQQRSSALPEPIIDEED